MAKILSDLMKEVWRIMGVKKVNTTAYHPQTDGLVERVNQSLCEMLVKYWVDIMEQNRIGIYPTYCLPTVPVFALQQRNRLSSWRLVVTPEYQHRPLCHSQDIAMDDYVQELVTRLT